MDALNKLIDRFMNMIPPRVQRMVRLGSILVWMIAAAVISLWSWQMGVDSAPELGQDLSHANIKAKIEREQNLKKQSDVVLPDLNDLLREEHTPASNQPEQAPPRRTKDNPLVGEDDRLMEAPNPVRSYDTTDRQGGTVYQGDGLEPLHQGGYTPRVDAGAGGVRSQPAPGLQTRQQQNLRGLDGQPLQLEGTGQNSNSDQTNTIRPNQVQPALQQQNPGSLNSPGTGQRTESARPAQSSQGQADQHLPFLGD